MERKEAIEVIKKNWPDNNFTMLREALETLIPELKEESEDEEIRKLLINLANQTWDGADCFKDFSKEKILAWLERHGESMEINPTEFDTRLQSLIGKFDNLPKEELIGSLSFWLNVVQNDGTYKADEKQDKQNPCETCSSPRLNCQNFPCEKKKNFDFSNKVEPKFKVDDFIVNDYGMVMRITGIKNDKYEFIFEDKLQSWPIVSTDRNCHLWTVQDAKDGDVLAFDNETMVIFKDLYNATTFHSYCHIEDGVFTASEKDVPDWWEGKGFQPATKEQRDTLEKAMANAGYTFDFEKKELKKIEQKPAEWSEEDEYMLDETVQHLEELIRIDKAKHCGCDVQYYQRDIDWLKSLRPQKQWKPTEAQLASLRIACDRNDRVGFDLTQLLKELKEL